MTNWRGQDPPGGDRVRELIRQRQEVRGTRFGAALRGAGQGFTVGLSDEMTGLARGAGAMWPGGMSPGEAYTAGTEGARERNRASREAFPWTYGGMEVAGAIAPLVAAALTTGGAGAAPVAASTAGRAIQGAGQVGRALATKPLLGTMTARTATRPLVGGAIEGAAYGFGHAEGNPLERLVPTAVGGGLGAGFGFGGQAAFRGAGWAGGRFMDLAGLRAATAESAESLIPRILRGIPGVETVQGQAERRIARAIPEGQVGPGGKIEGEDLMEAVEMLERSPQAAIVDISEETRGVAHAATVVPGRAREELPSFLRERSVGQEGRLIDEILELSEEGYRHSFRDSTTEIMARRKAAADPLYDAAHYNPDGSLRTVSRDVVQGEDNALNHQQLRDAYERGRKIARLDGVELPPLVQTMSVGGNIIGEEILEDIPVMGLDFMKQGLQDQVKLSARSGQGMGGRESRATLDILNSMLVRVDEAVSEYGAARAVWKGGGTELEALEVGRNLFKTAPADAEYLVSKMGESEREMFLRGGIEAFSQLLENTPKQHNLTVRRPLADRTLDTQRMRLLFPSDEAFASFQRTVADETEMAISKNAVTGQSKTANALLGVLELVGTDPAAVAAAGGVTAVVAGMAREALRGRQASYSSQVAEQMAPILITQGKDAAALTRRLIGPQQQSIRQEYLTRGVPTTAGAVAAPRAGELLTGDPGTYAGISLDQAEYLRSQGLTEEQIGLLAGSLTEQGVSDVMARRYGYRGVG